MKGNNDSLALTISNQFPELDVRADQCDTVRIYTGNYLICIDERGEVFTIKALGLVVENGYDFETKTVATLEVVTQSELLAAISGLLADLAVR